MKQYNGEKYIVSFTSFGQRFDDACRMIFSLMKQTYKNFHLVMTVYKDDLKDITENLQLLINNNLLEVIVADENLCPHLKYFYAMKKYWDKPIITVDDDRVYGCNTIQKLVEKYESLDYKSIVSCCAPVMTKHGDVLDERTSWCTISQRLKPNCMSYVAMAEGFCGVLYPPKCFTNLETAIPEIMNCLYDDDLFLKVLAIRNRVPVTQVNGRAGYEIQSKDIPHAQQFNLEKHNNAPMKYRSAVTKIFNDDLVKGFAL